MAYQPHVVAGPVNQGPRTQILPGQNVVFARSRVLPFDAITIEEASRARLGNFNLCDLLKTYIYLKEGSDIAQTFSIKRGLWRNRTEISSLDQREIERRELAEYKWWTAYRDQDSATIECWQAWKVHENHVGYWFRAIVFQIDPYDNWFACQCLEGHEGPPRPRSELRSADPDMVCAMSCFVKKRLLMDIAELIIAPRNLIDVEQSSEDSLSDNYIKEIDEESSE